MTWLYAVLVVVVLAALPLTWWLKRAGDRAWEQRRREQRMRELLKPTADAFVRLQITVRDQMTPALQRMAREINRMAEQMGPAFRRTAEAMRESDRP